MRIGFSHNMIGKKHGRAVRSLAVFFLLFTVADIAMPQYFCDEEVCGLPLKLIVSERVVSDTTAQNLVTSVSSTEESRPEKPAPEAPHEEDRFC